MHAGSAAAATFAWASICLGAPFLLNSFVVYPEIPAAFCVMVALLLPFFASVGLWMGFFYWIWGLPWPTAPYGPERQTTLSGLPAGGRVRGRNRRIATLEQSRMGSGYVAVRRLTLSS